MMLPTRCSVLLGSPPDEVTFPHSRDGGVIARLELMIVDPPDDGVA